MKVEPEIQQKLNGGIDVLKIYILINLSDQL